MGRALGGPADPRTQEAPAAQLLQMDLEEKPYLIPLPVQNFRIFMQETRTLDDAGPVQVERSYYAAMPRR